MGSGPWTALAVAAVAFAAAAPASAFVAPATPNTIIGTNSADPALFGTAGDDAIYGLGGDDHLDGRAGNDDLDGGSGADDLHGGPGDDAASYADALTGVTVALDDKANDGAPGEGDNVHSDVEDVYGGDFADTLVGDNQSNTLDGGAGDDHLTAGGGRDALYGGPGDDVIDAKDGEQDVVDCGTGRDRVVADRRDIVSSNCELRGVAAGQRTVATIRASNYFGVPPGVSVRAACRPGITVELHLHLRQLLRRKVPLHVAAGRRCEFRATFHVAMSKLGDATAVDVVARYAGIPGFGSTVLRSTAAVER